MPDYAQQAQQDGYGHFAPLTGSALTAGGTSTVAAAGVITMTGAGATAGGGGSVTAVTAVDTAGNFAITTGATPAAGTVAVVTFANGLPAVPKAITVNLIDTTASPNTSAAGAAGSVTANSFAVVSPALTAAHSYTVQYIVAC